MIRKTIIIVLLFVLVSFGGRIRLHEGENIDIEGIVLDDEGVIAVDDMQIHRDEIAKLIFTVEDDDYDYDYPAFETNQEEIEEYFAKAEELEARFPQANGITIKNLHKRNLTTDGRWVYYIHSVRKVLTADKLDWASLSLYLAEGENRIRIHVARSISPDGEVVDLDLSNITIAAPTRGARFFGKGFRKSFTVPNVEIGSIIEIAYTSEFYDPVEPNFFNFRYGFQTTEPIRQNRLIVEVPKDREIFYISQYLDDYFKTNYVTNIPGVELPESEIENPTLPEITETDSSKIYVWEMFDIEPMLEEPYMFHSRNVTPFVEGALYPDYSFYDQRYRELYLEHMTPTPTLDSLAFALTEDAENDSDKVAILYHWVQRNIRYVSIKGTLASSKAGHYAQMTYDNRYGDCTDKAVLFATLLRIVGIEAYPISLLTNTQGAFVHRDRFPSLWTNHCINEVWLHGKPLVLDATGTNMRFPYCLHTNTDAWYCNHLRGEIVYNPPVAPLDNLMNRKISVNIASDGDGVFDAKVYDSTYFTGSYESSFRGFFLRQDEDSEFQYIQRRASTRYPGSSVEDYRVYNKVELAEPFSFAIDYNAPNILTTAGEYYLLDTKVEHSFDEITLRERKYGVKIRMARQNANHIEISIPPELKVVYLPQPVNISNEYFEYEASYIQDGGRIIFRDRFDVKKIRIPVEDYQLYKEDAEKILEFNRQRIFLQMI